MAHVLLWESIGSVKAVNALPLEVAICNHSIAAFVSVKEKSP